MSAEFRLLDDLIGGDLSLFYAWQLFGGVGNAEALEKARRAITMQVQEGVIQLVREVNGSSETLADWEVRQVLVDEANWHKQSSEAEYLLSLTEAGANYVC